MLNKLKVSQCSKKKHCIGNRFSFSLLTTFEKIQNFQKTNFQNFQKIVTKWSKFPRFFRNFQRAESRRQIFGSKALQKIPQNHVYSARLPIPGLYVLAWFTADEPPPPSPSTLWWVRAPSATSIVEQQSISFCFRVWINFVRESRRARWAIAGTLSVPVEKSHLP